MVYGSFYNFSLGNFFSGINGNFLFWALIFLGLFLLGNFVLKKVFVNNPRIGTVIALIFTTLAVYWMSKNIT